MSVGIGSIQHHLDGLYLIIFGNDDAEASGMDGNDHTLVCSMYLQRSWYFQ